ncbi:two component transcriptional regulator, LytTR family [Tenacibaculum sp. MAR_2009_124]|uniref:LytR/AlgR family response regulator transcription factor n=1 Tax=Tenacibaculum sp. MAR_2009_124 TaxID=1250059 RepID=UPI00089A97D7|nr:LytTR family DNA-binding domain-containing protein [Tenacibaculum sp. MAR_2009_124]SED16947.1 two component transcriptional regulator, LytTR family [Tenacibaculum sp. MAR_2009_124]
MKLTAILVDDEENALESLALKISRFFPNISIIGKFQNPQEAIVFINRNNPDVLFLDVEMPVLTGFDVLAKLTNPNFEIIFVTAYSNYAIEAFKYSAIGYVLKPIDNDELKSMINNALKNVNQKNKLIKNERLLNHFAKTTSNSNKLVIPTNKGLLFIPHNEILHIEGYDGYTKIHTNTSEIISSYNIGKYEKMLSDSFFKCHKSHIINLQKIRAFENEGYIVLENERRVPVSKMNRSKLLSLF